MPTIKNTFIKSKMNKDLDDRLLSNGEYRNAQNVNISRSEGEDVGALENVLGNTLLSSVTPTQTSEIIGYIKDDINNCVYTFSTNYTDTSDGELSNPAPYGAECRIVKTDLSTGTDSILVQGRFLNLSKTHPIYGVNLLEDLLFWTDDRNQPRKINVKKVSSSTYYSTEDTISVAKYYPYKVPKLYDEVSVNVKTSSSTGVPTQDFKNFVTLADAKKLKAGMMLLKGGDSTPSSPTSTLERFIVAVFQGNDNTSYFLTNRSIITTNNTVVAFGFSNSKNSFKKYLDYSIIGAAVRYNADVTLGLRQVNYTVSSESNMVDNTSGGGPTRTLVSVPFTTNGSGINATIDVTISGGSILNVAITSPGSGYVVGDTITISAAQIAFAFITQTVLGSNYTVGSVIEMLGNGDDATALVTSSNGNSNLQNIGSGYINGSNVTLPAPLGGSAAGFTYNFGTGSLIWSLNSTNFINVDAPTTNTFFWSGSSIPYTKMLVNCPGFTSPDTTITAAAYQGAAPDGVVYYKITTNIAHNISSSTVVNSVAMVELSWPNPNYNSAFTGDSELLKDKFVRFAYRFKFDDGEYSLISPFTQPVFVPKQRGFIQESVSEVAVTLAGTSSGNVTGTPIQNFATGEEDIQASTIVSFFENNIDTISLQIEMPYPLGDSNDPNTLDIKSKLGVVEIDILYKESDGLVIKIVDTIPSEIFRLNEDDTVNTSNIFTYNYESKEPFKLVSPIKEIERVYDKVPIRALAQESAGSRIIYGNFIDKHTPPSFLKYNVRVTEKEAPTISNITNSAVQTLQAGKEISNSYLSYPTHTLKQNRNYQIGFVLADRYGRQSDVILAPLDNKQYQSDVGSTIYESATIFNPYFNSYYTRNIATWRGDMLEILLREAIPSTATADGYPGIYKSGRYDTTLGAAVSSSNVILCNELDSNVAVGDIVVVEANILAITAVNFTTKNVTLSSSITAAINADVEIYGPENKLGWHSYKVVVKQLTQDYYNAYLGNVAYLSPGSALATSVGNYAFSGSSFVTSLVADNVNKIPADLIQVAPEQNQFGTSDALLYPRVGGTVLRDNPAIDYIYATNFFFGAQSASINAYGKIRDIGVAEVTFDSATPPVPDGFKTPIQSSGVQSASSDPTAIILTMPNADVIGRAFWRPTGLYVFEVGALESSIEIFWETSTCGLVSDLNNLVATGPTSSVVTPNAPITPGVPADDSVPSS
tara:strand:+ start:1855 stop:5496 length:3642 start_codon:yes stop_codon:yes gene_type:complete